MLEIDHDNREVYVETMQLQVDPPAIDTMQPSAEAVAARLTSPVMTTYLDTEKIAFERWAPGIFLYMCGIKDVESPLIDYFAWCTCWCFWLYSEILYQKKSPLLRIFSISFFKDPFTFVLTKWL